MGLWWRWQDLNLRPWDYDSSVQLRIRQKSGVFLIGVEIRGQDFRGQHPSLKSQKGTKFLNVNLGSKGDELSAEKLS